VGHPETPVHLGQRSAVNVIQVNHLQVVDEGDLLAVRRPHRRVAVAGAELGQGLLYAGPVGRTKTQLVLARAVGEVGDGLAVRRPRGVALGKVRGPGQVADHTVLGGEAEDLAASGEHGSLPGWGDIAVGEPLTDLDRPRPQGRAIRHHLHIDRLGGLGREIHDVEPATVFKD